MEYALKERSFGHKDTLLQAIGPDASLIAHEGPKTGSRYAVTVSLRIQTQQPNVFWRLAAVDVWFRTAKAKLEWLRENCEVRP